MSPRRFRTVSERARAANKRHWFFTGRPRAAHSAGSDHLPSAPACELRLIGSAAEIRAVAASWAWKYTRSWNYRAAEVRKR